MRVMLTVVAIGLSASSFADAPNDQGPATEAFRMPASDWPKAAVTFHVAVDGDDAAPGTSDRPFASLERARDEIRRLRTEGALPTGGAEVVVHGGQYAVQRTFALDHRDSGDVTTPVRYRAAEGEVPVFSGGVRLTGFEPVTDPSVKARLPEESRDRVFQLSLEKHGIKELKPLELGGFSSGLGFKTHPVMELFYDGAAMPMSRWPNEGFVQVADISVKDGHTIHGRVGSKTGRLVYEGDRPSRWTDEAAPMLYGYWFFEWADSYERVASIDTEARELVLEEPYSSYGYRAGASFYAINLLSEIDMPGEWYIDRTHRMLYFYPPSDPTNATVELSVVDFPLVSLNDVGFTSFEGLAWELGGVDAVQVRGGAHCLFSACTVRRCGGDGMVVQGGTGHTVFDCEIYSMGRGGIVMAGGDRKTLEPGGHVIENCDIHELSRIDHTYTPAILLSGVGNRIAHNELHHIPSSAIRLGGNDHVVEYNEIHHVVQESDDQGGADMWGNPTFRGNVYRYNWWHHIGNQVNGHEFPECGQAGIRLDDAISGTHIHGNVFHKASAGKLGFGGIQIHGGKDNLVENNVFVDCMAAVSFSPWSDDRWRAFVADAMKAPDIDPALYLERYPELARLLEDHDVNHVRRNLAVRCGDFTRRDNGRSVLTDNVVLEDAPLALREPDDRLDLTSLVPLLKEQGLDSIPLENIGRNKGLTRIARPTP